MSLLRDLVATPKTPKIQATTYTIRFSKTPAKWRNYLLMYRYA